MLIKLVPNDCLTKTIIYIWAPNPMFATVWYGMLLCMKTFNFAVAKYSDLCTGFSEFHFFQNHMTNVVGKLLQNTSATQAYAVPGN